MCVEVYHMNMWWSWYDDYDVIWWYDNHGYTMMIIWHPGVSWGTVRGRLWADRLDWELSSGMSTRWLYLYLYLYFICICQEVSSYFHVHPNMWSLSHQVSVYNVFVERGNVAVLQCGVPASVRDSVEVREREIAIMRWIGMPSRCDSKYTEAEEVQV